MQILKFCMPFFFSSNVCTKHYSLLTCILKCNVQKLENLLNLRMDGILCRVCNIFNVMDHAFVRESFLFKCWLFWVIIQGKIKICWIPFQNKIFNWNEKKFNSLGHFQVWKKTFFHLSWKKMKQNIDYELVPYHT